MLVRVWPSVQRFAVASNSVSGEHLTLGAIEVVAANSPTLYAAAAAAAAGGAAVMQVHAGDTVKRGQVLVLIDNPELAARLAQERSNADAVHADVRRAQVGARQQNAVLQRDQEHAGIDLTTAQTELDCQTQAF